MENERIPDEASEQFVAVLTHHQSAMLACIQSLVAGNPGAADLLQEVNSLLWEARGHWEPGVDFAAWSFETIRRHLSINRARLKAEGWLVVEDDLLERLTPQLENPVEEIERRQLALRACLAKLKPKQRDPLYHRYSPGASLERFAASTRRDTGTVKALLVDVRTSLLRSLEKELSTKPTNAAES